jgi:hypothetical protein
MRRIDFMVGRDVRNAGNRADRVTGRTFPKGCGESARAMESAGLAPVRIEQSAWAEEFRRPEFAPLFTGTTVECFQKAGRMTHATVHVPAERRAATKAAAEAFAAKYEVGLEILPAESWHEGCDLFVFTRHRST